MKQAWKSDPKCQKCRRTSPNMQWGRWAIAEGIGIIASTNPVHEEGLRLTCVRCGFQWLMDLAPIDWPKPTAVAE